MKAATLVALAFILNGCATQEVERYPAIRPDLAIVTTSQAEVNRVCRTRANGQQARNGRWDNGHLIMNGQNIAGCYQPWSNTIYVTYRATAGTVKHELCHASGRSVLECEGVH